MTHSDHMRYLTRLCRQAPPHPSKRANWLKFCAVCGGDISGSARGVRVCATCIPEKRHQRQMEQSIGRIRRRRGNGVKSNGI